ncbi:MAG: hypothetical protein H6719_07985 [Sandaracinaceae bacterium]|nr:hypothetical protein [Sandaracinaceae bacterium]
MGEIIYETDLTALYFHRREGIIHHEIRGFVNGPPFRDLLERGAELMAEHGARKWLSDDRGHEVLSPADEEWAKTVWFPRVKAAGWTHWAIVRPAKSVGRINMERFAREYSAMGITARLFVEPSEALAWLSKPDPER